MRFRKLLLATTSLGVFALSPLPVIAQDAALLVAYENYVAASSGGDDNAKAAAEDAFRAECERVGSPELEVCIALATGVAVATPAEPARADQPPVDESTSSEPDSMEAAPAEQLAPEAAPERAEATSPVAEPAPAVEAPAAEAAPTNLASDPALIAAYENYVSASSGTDPDAKTNAEAEFLVECNRVGIASLDECVVLMGGNVEASSSNQPATTDNGQPTEQVPEADNVDAPVAAAPDSAKDDDGSVKPAASDQAEPAVPASDAEAQAETVSEEEISATVDAKGEPATELTSENIENARPAPQTNNSFVINIGVNINLFTPYKDRDRIAREGDEVTYERLDNGRYRQIVMHGDGTRIVTVWNRFGEIERRIKIRPDGTRIVLIYYTGERDGEWRDPGDDLPPFRLTIPVSEYVFYAERENEKEIADFLLLPPLEKATRVYSVDEVKRSARIRDMVRRVEIGDLTFDTGEASIERDQVGSLTKVAEAMKRILDHNPNEVFLIEGHTDAVGSDEANLVLSDARAETVALLLTDFYDIPPENLTTQGYGERYLKVETEDAERANRRVTVRRITTLVAPST